jgi:hypothetical protein
VPDSIIFMLCTTRRARSGCEASMPLSITATTTPAPSTPVAWTSFARMARFEALEKYCSRSLG